MASLARRCMLPTLGNQQSSATVLTSTRSGRPARATLPVNTFQPAIPINAFASKAIDTLHLVASSLPTKRCTLSQLIDKRCGQSFFMPKPSHDDGISLPNHQTSSMQHSAVTEIGRLARADIGTPQHGHGISQEANTFTVLLVVAF